jgi:hypothetical protein
MLPFFFVSCFAALATPSDVHELLASIDANNDQKITGSGRVSVLQLAAMTY